MGKIFDKEELERPRSGGVRLIKYLVRIEAIHYTGEARESLETGCCSVEDIDCAILQGRLHKKEKDELKESFDGLKYTFIGPDESGYEFYCCGKVLRNSSSEFFLVITAHDARVNYVSKQVRRKNV